MFSVSRVMSSASTTPISDSGSDDEDRQRIEERAELHDEDQIHQHHRDAERGEDARRTPRLWSFDLAALRDRDSPAAAGTPSTLRMHVLRHVADRRASHVRADGDDALPLIVVDLRRARARA